VRREAPLWAQPLAGNRARTSLPPVPRAESRRSPGAESRHSRAESGRPQVGNPADAIA